MDSYEFNQLLLSLVVAFDILFLIFGHYQKSPFEECFEGSIECFITNWYTWQFIINISYLLYISYFLVKKIRYRQYIRQIDHQVAPPV